MYIKSLSYHDLTSNWRLEETSFKKLTLLVGASGVGKTQILRSIRSLREIATGSSKNGARWRTEFSTTDKQTYFWEGEFETRPVAAYEIVGEMLSGRQREQENPATIVYEKLLLDGEKIIDRNPERILFRGNKTVKLAQEQSVIHLLKEEPDISPVLHGFQKVLLHGDDHLLPDRLPITDRQTKIDRYGNIEDIRESEEDLKTKLFLASIKAIDVFQSIRERFVEVFPFVEDVTIESLPDANVFFLFRGIPFVQIREKGVDGWISEWVISSGMRRTLWHIAELHLCARGTVILIDEFENSLGVNCIDEVTRQLINPTRDLQFIITSHHPYIINNIPSSNWKLVTRRGGVVKVLDAEELDLPKSKHDAFSQLINLDAYAEGPET